MLPDCPPERAQELLEQGSGVVRSRCRLRMVLDAEYRQGAVTKPFDGSVVQIDVRDLEIRRTFDRCLIPFNCKSVVLGGD